MSVFVIAVPALLVVVLGYAVGYAVWDALGAPRVAPEAFGWGTGLGLLVVVTWALLPRRRRRRRGWQASSAPLRTPPAGRRVPL